MWRILSSLLVLTTFATLRALRRSGSCRRSKFIPIGNTVRRTLTLTLRSSPWSIKFTLLALFSRFVFRTSTRCWFIRSELSSVGVVQRKLTMKVCRSRLMCALSQTRIVSCTTSSSRKFLHLERIAPAGQDKMLDHVTVNSFSCLNYATNNLLWTDAGDSGGGFYYKVGQVWFIQGIVSATVIDQGRCDVSKYSVYTNVLKFADWIKDSMRDKIEVAWNDISLNCKFLRNFEWAFEASSE